MNQKMRPKNLKNLLFCLMMGFFSFSFISSVQANKDKPAVSGKKAKAAPIAKAPVAKTKMSKAEKLAKSFAPVDLNKQKLSAGWDQPYLLGAYGLCWLAILIYLLVLAKRVNLTDADLNRLEKRLSNLESVED